MSAKKTPTSLIYKETLMELSKKFRGIRKKFYKVYLKDVFNKFAQDKEKYLNNKKLQFCKICGEPSLNEICNICKLKKEFKKI